MSITEVLNHAQQAKDNLLQQFKGKANIEGFIDAVIVQIQELEVALVDLDTERRLSTAIGTQLDNLGTIIKRLRGALGDENYRAVLRARIRANRSEGLPEDILAVARLLVDDVNTLEYLEFFPASFLLRVNDALTIGTAAMIAELSVARAGGVGGSFEYTLSADAVTFTFASGDTNEASATQGMGNDAATTGGKFADVEVLS